MVAKARAGAVVPTGGAALVGAAAEAVALITALGAQPRPPDPPLELARKCRETIRALRIVAIGAETLLPF